jgi:hypothetical protein
MKLWRVKFDKTRANHREGWYIGSTLDLFCGRDTVQVSVESPAILSKAFRGFPYSLQTNSGSASSNGLQPLSSSPYLLTMIISLSYSTLFLWRMQEKYRCKVMQEWYSEEEASYKARFLFECHCSTQIWLINFMFSLEIWQSFNLSWNFSHPFLST